MLSVYCSKASGYFPNNRAHLNPAHLSAWHRDKLPLLLPREGAYLLVWPSGATTQHKTQQEGERMYRRAETAPQEEK